MTILSLKKKVKFWNKNNHQSIHNKGVQIYGASQGNVFKKQSEYKKFYAVTQI